MAVIAYCVKCKEKKEMVDPQEGVTKNGRIITKGTCPDCGTKMSLIGGVKKDQYLALHQEPLIWFPWVPKFLSYKKGAQFLVRLLNYLPRNLFFLLIPRKRHQNKIFHF